MKFSISLNLAENSLYKALNWLDAFPLQSTIRSQQKKCSLIGTREGEGPGVRSPFSLRTFALSSTFFNSDEMNFVFGSRNLALGRVRSREEKSSEYLKLWTVVRKRNGTVKKFVRERSSSCCKYISHACFLLCPILTASKYISIFIPDFSWIVYDLFRSSQNSRKSRYEKRMVFQSTGMEGGWIVLSGCMYYLPTIHWLVKHFSWCWFALWNLELIVDLQMLLTLFEFRQQSKIECW